MMVGRTPNPSRNRSRQGWRSRARSWLLLMGIVVVSVMGCSHANTTNSRRGTTLTFAAEPYDLVEPWGDYLVFLPLTMEVENGDIEGRLAESWEDSTDYRTRTYHLRKDVLWHDGRPVTAADVKFTAELLGHADIQEVVVDSITVIDDYTVRVEAPPLAGGMDNVRILPKHLLQHLDPSGFHGWQFWKEPIGNGPYAFVRYEPETMIEFKANPDYYRGPPRIHRVILKFIGQNVASELRSGQIDAGMCQPAHVPQLMSDPRYRLYHKAHPEGSLAIYWQHRNPLFQDARVRRALTLSINRREMLQLLNVPEDLPLFDGPITPRQFRRRDLPQPLPYDPVQADTLLKEAGWHDRDRDGVREKDGKAFRIKALVPTGAARGYGLDKLAIYVQSQLQLAGVQMEFQSIDRSNIRERLGKGDFDVAFMIVQHHPTWYQKYFGGDSPTGYNNPDVMKLLHQAVATAAPDELDRIHRDLMEIFRKDQPITYLGPATSLIFAHRRVKGLSSPTRAHPLCLTEDLWLEDEN